ncbi:MAG: glycoside hydrolase family 38 C-terminal domain-containing protein [Elusimicrobiota bacterium]
MLISKKVINKIVQIEKRYSLLRYQKVCDVPAEIYETFEHFVMEPNGGKVLDWKPVSPGTRWGDSWKSAWFRGDIKLPDTCDGKKVFITAKTGGETLFIVDGMFKGVFDNNHQYVAMANPGVTSKIYHLAFEAYTGHPQVGCRPDEIKEVPSPGCRVFNGISVYLEREDVTAFVYDLRVLRQVAGVVEEHSLRRANLMRCLAKVFEIVFAMPEECDEHQWRPKLAYARDVMKPLLTAKNGDTTPFIGLIGHSHIDTAWLWPISETWRKCARTFSSVLNLMDQYPEFIFLQTAPYHVAVMKERYPKIYEAILSRVKEGRWEPNGAMWVEPDCNIPSGEAFIRQLLIGQTATREMFGYTSDTLWLPDVFGYSAALPQILQGCNVHYFCTTKMSWNDTTRFPYDTFRWRGIDGSEVITHLNHLHHGEGCIEGLSKRWNEVQHKDVQDRYLAPVGHGDGGGGPVAEDIEFARRITNLEGCPKTGYTTLSKFMNGVRDELKDLPAWSGELYLEFHRGTLTSISEVKKGNRKAEIALRNAEFVCTLAQLRGVKYPKEELTKLWKALLVNQFHDILPGSSIAKVNDEAVDAFKQIIHSAEGLAAQAMRVLSNTQEGEDDSGESVLVLNSLSWVRQGELCITTAKDGMYPDADTVNAQWVEDIEGKKKLAITGLNFPALGGRVVTFTKKRGQEQSVFKVENNKVETPYATITFDGIGRITSFIDKKSGREIVKPGGALNTLWLGEDIPDTYDNWDIDREQRLKMQVQDKLVKREVVSNGLVQLRIRSEYKLGDNSVLLQDMVFHAESAQVDFETQVDWKEKHKLLKAGFELDILADNAKHEIQYGYVERPVHENLQQDRARFEVCCHKWVDLSETGFGIAVINDSKYGVSVLGSDIRLSLLKSGRRPDPRGDEGRHVFTYALVPHACAFSVESVIRPAYELNVPVIEQRVTTKCSVLFDSIVKVKQNNVILESLKRAEDGDGFILRLYDAFKTGGLVNLKFNIPVSSVVETNMLEEKCVEHKVSPDGELSIYLKPFEIKTLRWGCKP